MSHRIRSEGSSILAVSSDSDLLDELQAVLGGDAPFRREGAPDGALASLVDQPAATLIVDGRLPDGGARRLAAFFLSAVPDGRAVVLAALDDPDTLMRLSVEDHRLSVVFRPWNDAQLRACLLFPSLDATGTG